jgi:DNA-binding MarR family transcriptional regulator
MGKEHDTDKMTTIMRFPTADAQYAALMHFWKMYGLIERPPAASLRDIAKKMGRTTSTIKYQVDRLKLVSHNLG